MEASSYDAAREAAYDGLSDLSDRTFYLLEPEYEIDCVSALR